MALLSRAEFEKVVREALDGLPPEFHYALENVSVVVEEEPGPAELADLDCDDHELFGIYQGVPLSDRGHEHSGLPDRIVIYRGPLLRSFRTVKRIAKEIRRTVIHEIGHHLGLSDEQMPY
jgi:predicted Zn-dependent protease with MMP-like domain